jgi:hypothetical protein
MKCTPCWPQVHTSVDAAGHCEAAGHENTWLCIFPNHDRADGVFHGEHCTGRCGCGRLFCITHSHAHARWHQSQLPDCFPRFASMLSDDAITAASRAHARTVRGEEPFPELAERNRPAAGRGGLIGPGAAVTCFLLYVTPGLDAAGALGFPNEDIDAARRGFTEGPVRADVESLGAWSHLREWLPDDALGAARPWLAELLTAQRLTRITLLALRALGDALSWLGVDSATDERELPRNILDRGRAPYQLEPLSRWASAGALAPLAFRTWSAETLTALGYLRADDSAMLAVALDSTLSARGGDPRELPTSPDEAAEWILHGDERRFAPGPQRGGGTPLVRPGAQVKPLQPPMTGEMGVDAPA